VGEPEQDRVRPDPGNPTVDFHGERRCNETHESTTDPEAKLARKGGSTTQSEINASNSPNFSLSKPMACRPGSMGLTPGRLEEALDSFELMKEVT
jgi:hypothetical protein